MKRWGSIISLGHKLNEEAELAGAVKCWGSGRMGSRGILRGAVGGRE